MLSNILNSIQYEENFHCIFLCVIIYSFIFSWVIYERMERMVLVLVLDLWKNRTNIMKIYYKWSLWYWILQYGLCSSNGCVCIIEIDDPGICAVHEAGWMNNPVWNSRPRGFLEKLVFCILVNSSVRCNLFLMLWVSFGGERWLVGSLSLLFWWFHLYFFHIWKILKSSTVLDFHVSSQNPDTYFNYPSLPSLLLQFLSSISLFDPLRPAFLFPGKYSISSS